MFLSALALSVVMSQTTAEAAADKSAAAAERAAVAAERAAAAVEKIAASLAAPAADAPTDVKAAPAQVGWVGSVGLGLAFITGNTQTLTMTGNLSADRKWDVWAIGLRASGAYGLANPSANVVGSTSSTTARRAGGSIRGDRSFGSGFASLFVLAGTEFDHVKNIESRTVGELGTGLTFFDQKQGDLEKLYLRLDLAAHAGYETHYQYFPQASAIDPYGVIILAPRAALTFRWGFSKDVRVSEELEFVPYVLAPTAGRLLINSTTKLNARLTERLSLASSLLVNYDSMPPNGGAGSTPRLPTDVALTVGVEAAF